MPLRPDSGRRSIYWFIIDGILQWDRQGWEFFFKTPLFGFCITKYFPDITYVDEVRYNRVWLGLICRWPTHEDDAFFRFNWEKRWQPRLVIRSTQD
jgi:hypothetical protein